MTELELAERTVDASASAKRLVAELLERRAIALIHLALRLRLSAELETIDISVSFEVPPC